MGGEILPHLPINISMEATKEKIVSDTSIIIPRPNKFKVVLHNDDTTPMEFVIELLKKVFQHSQEKAEEITTKVHNEGKGIAGIYYYEIAEQKAIECTMISRSAGYSLTVNVEEG